MSIAQQLKRVEDPMFEHGMSEYEKARIENIRANEAALRALGLDCNQVTVVASGNKAPLKKRLKKKIPMVATRFSRRILQKPAVCYSEVSAVGHRPPAPSTSPRRNKRKASAPAEKEEDIIFPEKLPSKRTRKSTVVYAPGATEVTHPPSKQVASGMRESIKFLNVDFDKLDAHYLGRIIAPLGGQVKRAVMECASAGGTPTFSRMSGIQQWANAIMLFVNVYGGLGEGGYKNVFLNKGKQITWFAQPRQWEGTPIVQDMIHSAGALIQNEDGTTSEEPESNVPVLLFCRNLGLGYVYCGRLSYLAHAPERIPIRFVWQLDDHDMLSKSEPFQALVQACEEMCKQ